MEYLHQLFGIPHGTFVSPPTFMYLLNHLLLPVWTQRYSLRALGYNLVPLHSDAQITSALAIRALLAGSCVPVA